MELGRRDRPYLGLNMGGFAANPELAHSALFGHRKGAFSQAFDDRPGALGVADGGVLFLDEIGDMPRSVQRLLKEFLAEETFGAYARLGEDEVKRRADAVVFMATNRNLEALVRSGEFEGDFHRRLVSGHVLQVPALAEHAGDIPEIVLHYLDLFNRQYLRQVSISKEGMDFLAGTTWEHNVSGLRSAVHALVTEAEGPGSIVLGPRQVERAIAGLRGRDAAAPEGGGERSLREVELEHCLAVWERCGRHRRRASEVLEIAENTLRKKLLEGVLRRCGGDLAGMAAFFGKNPAQIEADLATYKVAMDS